MSMPLRQSHHRAWIFMATRLATTLVVVSLSRGQAVSALRTTFLPFNRTLLQQSMLKLLSGGGVSAPASTVSSTELLTLHHYHEPVGSTQDVARQLLKDQASASTSDGDTASDGKQQPTKFLAVVADEQTQGRGTQGRTWEGGSQKGNLYLTVCIPMDAIPVKLTLLPLQVGALVAQRVAKLIQACRQESDNDDDTTPKTRVKWPNDVLVNDAKISGTLIENEIVDGTTWLLIGIGVNIAFAPSLAKSPGRHVRRPTCVQEWCDQRSTGGEDSLLPSDTAGILGEDLANALAEWAADTTTDQATKDTKVIEDWKLFAEFGRKYELRGDVEAEMAGDHKGEEVIAVDIHYDGQLVVRGENGEERLLIANYMY